MRNEKFLTKYGILNLHHTKYTHWAKYVNEKNFDSSSFLPLIILTDYVLKEKEMLIFLHNGQGKDICCAA